MKLLHGGFGVELAQEWGAGGDRRAQVHVHEVARGAPAVLPPLEVAERPDLEVAPDVREGLLDRHLRQVPDRDVPLDSPRTRNTERRRSATARPWPWSAVPARRPAPAALSGSASAVSAATLSQASRASYRFIGSLRCVRRDLMSCAMYGPSGTVSTTATPRPRAGRACETRTAHACRLVRQGTGRRLGPCEAVAHLDVTSTLLLCRAAETTAL